MNLRSLPPQGFRMFQFFDRQVYFNIIFSILCLESSVRRSYILHDELHVLIDKNGLETILELCFLSVYVISQWHNKRTADVN